MEELCVNSAVCWRLQTSGFSLEVSNTGGGTVMVGVRVLVGSQALERAPSYIEVFGRSTHVTLTRARWYDLPFTRDESLLADKKLTIFCESPSGFAVNIFALME